MRDTHVFVKNLVNLVPHLKQLYTEHLDSYDELLPHVFFGDVSRYVQKGLHASIHDHDQSAEADLKAIFEYLERGMQTGSDNVKDLIVVSFLENLSASIDFELLKKRLGPNLKKYYTMQT